MKYIKKFEDKIDELKELLSHFNSFFEEIGYDYKGYIDRGRWISEYYKDDEYMFALTVNKDNNLIFQESLNNSGDDEINYISNYLKTINGLKIQNQTQTNQLFIKIVFYVSGNVYDIMEQITMDDFLFKQKTIKYNL